MNTRGFIVLVAVLALLSAVVWLALPDEENDTPSHADRGEGAPSDGPRDEPPSDDTAGPNRDVADPSTEGHRTSERDDPSVAHGIYVHREEELQAAAAAGKPINLLGPDGATSIVPVEPLPEGPYRDEESRRVTLDAADPAERRYARELTTLVCEHWPPRSYPRIDIRIRPQVSIGPEGERFVGVKRLGIFGTRGDYWYHEGGLMERLSQYNEANTLPAEILREYGTEGEQPFFVIEITHEECAAVGIDDPGFARVDRSE